MVYFYTATGVLIILCLWNLIPVLLNKKSITQSNLRQTNIELAKRRVSLINEHHGDNEQLQSELEATLLEDLEGPDYEINHNRSKNIKTLMAVLVALPLIAVALYTNLGNTKWKFNAALPTPKDYAEDPVTSMKVLVDQLDQKLTDDPSNAEGWAIRAQVAMSMNDFEKAESSYARVHQLVGDDPDILTAWADASMLVNGNSYTIEISDRIERALALEPSHQNALWIGGIGALQAEEYNRAKEYLVRLKSLIQDNPEASLQIQARIDQVNNILGVKVDTKIPLDDAASRSIPVFVSLSAELAKLAEIEDQVFVFARTKERGAIPVAAVKLNVSDLPATVVLDSSSAMMTEHTLDSVDRVEIVARVTKSGTPFAVSGDLTSEPVTVNSQTLTQSHISIVIDQIVK